MSRRSTGAPSSPRHQTGRTSRGRICRSDRTRHIDVMGQPQHETSRIRRAQPAPRIPPRRAGHARAGARSRGRCAHRRGDAREPRRARDRRLRRGADRRRSRHRREPHPAGVARRRSNATRTRDDRLSPISRASCSPATRVASSTSVRPTRCFRCAACSRYATRPARSAACTLQPRATCMPSRPYWSRSTSALAGRLQIGGRDLVVAGEITRSPDSGNLFRLAPRARHEPRRCRLDRPARGRQPRAPSPARRRRRARDRCIRHVIKPSSAGRRRDHDGRGRAAEPAQRVRARRQLPAPRGAARGAAVGHRDRARRATLRATQDRRSRAASLSRRKSRRNHSWR